MLLPSGTDPLKKARRPRGTERGRRERISLLVATYSMVNSCSSTGTGSPKQMLSVLSTDAPVPSSIVM